MEGCRRNIQKPVKDPNHGKNVKNIIIRPASFYLDTLPFVFSTGSGENSSYRIQFPTSKLYSLRCLSRRPQYFVAEVPNSLKLCLKSRIIQEGNEISENSNRGKEQASNKVMEPKGGMICTLGIRFKGKLMLANTNSKFEQLLTQLLIDRRYQDAMDEGLQKYQIKQFKVASLAPNKIAEMYYHITTKFYFSHSPEPTEAWHENELRVFIYLLVGYCFLEKKAISELNSNDWQFFSDIFNQRNPIIFEFQGLSLLKRSTKCNRWELEEVSLLDSIIRTKSIKNKWNQIARDLFVRSNKRYFKTSKQCREYWINHLDPVPVRSSWSISEDHDLISAVIQLGKKWAKVSKHLGGKRTEHMVKNRFKSLFHFESKQRQYFQGSQSSEQDIIQAMLRKFKNGKEEELKLSLFEKELKGSSKRQNLADTYDGKTPQQQEDQNIFTCKTKDNLRQKNLNYLKEDQEKQLIFPTKQSFNSFKEIAIEDCISLFFQHDSFLGCPSHM